MREANDEHTARRTARSVVSARNTSSSSERGRLLQEETGPSDSNTSQATPLSNVSTTLDDTFSRLQQIRRALASVEASMVHADRSRERFNRASPALSNAESDIRPPHSAILLSEENNPNSFDSASLLERLDEIRPELPEYMRATANMIQNVSRWHGAAPQTGNTVEASRRSNLVPGPANTLNPRTSEGAPGRYVRPNRENRTPRERASHLRPEGSRDNYSSHTLPAWRAAYHDDDSGATLLGRRVAAAAMRARSSDTPAGERRSRVIPSPSLMRSEYNLPSIVIPRDASRVVIPPRVPDRVSRRIAQFESTANESRRRENSDGSETEVDNVVFRPARVRRRVSDGFRTSNVLQRRMNDDGIPPTLPEVERISPLSSPSPGGIYSTGPSSSESSPQTETERPPAVSSRLHNLFGHLNRLSNTLSDAQSSGGPTSSSTDGDNLDGALFSRQTQGQERINLFHEVVDEEEGRTYRIRRRVNADGIEHVHQINSDEWWDDDSYTNPFFPSTSIAASRDARSPTVQDDDQRIFSPLQPTTNDDNGTASLLDRLRRQSRNFVSENQRSDTDLPPLISRAPPQGTSTRRHRGWARLDANGDEIPTDEEEEIERMRAALRLRNNQSAWRRTNSPSTTRARLEYLAPTTRSVFSHATDDDEDEPVRVRLNMPLRVSNARSHVSDTRAEKERETDPERVFFGTSEPYHISPLPTPAEEMLAYGSRQTSRRLDRTWTLSTRPREKEFAAC